MKEQDMEIKQKKRSEIPAEYKWKLEDLYAADADWRKDVDIIKDSIETLTGFQGKLTTGEVLHSCLQKYFAVYDIVLRVYVYAKMKLDEDTSVSASQGMADITQSMYVKFSSATAFITPEILTHDATAIGTFIATTPGLKLYEHYLDDIMRSKAHTRSTEVETILANAYEIGSNPSNIADMLRNADMKFGSVVDENGNIVEITHSRYSAMMESPDRRVRKDVFETGYDAYGKLKNSYAAMLSSSIKKDIFFAKSRNFDNTLNAALFGYNIPRTVYEQLIEATNEFLPALHRYMALRKKALKLDELHVYDNFAPLVEEVNTKMTFADAKKKLVEGLAPLGKDYLAAMERGMESGWIDVYSNEGKKSGAYSWGTATSHPYVLLNYEDKLDDMFTLAHEMGHAMHSYYSWGNQPNVYANYSLFLAEVASTVNETLLMEYMLKNCTDEKMHTYLLGEYLNQFR